jgi:hypothetical protein
MNKITRDDTEHGVEYVRADEAQAEVLEQCRINGMSAEREDALRAEIKRLKAAQPAPVQEPEYVYTCNGCDTLYREDDVSCDCTVNGLMEFTRHILAPDTTPPAAQRQWVGLTDKERNQLWRDVVKWGDPSHDDVDLMKAIEDKLKERNT